MLKWWPLCLIKPFNLAVSVTPRTTKRPSGDCDHQLRPAPGAARRAARGPAGRWPVAANAGEARPAARWPRRHAARRSRHGLPTTGQRSAASSPWPSDHGASSPRRSPAEQPVRPATSRSARREVDLQRRRWHSCSYLSRVHTCAALTSTSASYSPSRCSTQCR